jgi:hypothetical protein
VVSAGAGAEYGRGSGVLTPVIRSGANDDFDARSFFSGNVSKLRFNQFGGTGATFAALAAGRTKERSGTEHPRSYSRVASASPVQTAA